MMYHSFDTHEAVKSFIKSGIKEPQAEVIIRAIAGSRDADMSHLATKTDVMVTREELKEEIMEVKVQVAEVRAEVARVEHALTGEIHRVTGEIHIATNQVLFRIIGAMIAIVGLGVSSLIGVGFWVLQHYIVK